MPTNANTFNSRVTSEALEAKYRQVFPAQGGAELVQDLFASGVIQPVVDFSTVAEGSVLAPDLQTAWDFSTGTANATNATVTAINNTGFWKVDLNGFIFGSGYRLSIDINDGLGTKRVWNFQTPGSSTNPGTVATQDTFVVFLRAGDSLTLTSTNANALLSIWYRQIADVNGNLVNPLGFSFS